MRSWFFCLLAVGLLVPALTGCQLFNPSSSGSSKKGRSPFGFLSRNKLDREVDADEVLDPLGARDSNRLLLDDLAPSQLATTVKSRLGVGSDEEAARKHYEDGQKLYEQGIAQMKTDPEGEDHKQLFTEAANKFRLAAASWPDSEIEESAAYFEGEAYFFADRYVQSNRAFEKLIASYSGSRYLDMAENRRFAIAVYWLKLSETDGSISFTDPKRPKTGLAAEARRVLHRIKIDDPTGKLAGDASMALGKAFLQAENYYEAADTFEDLRKNYPGSKHLFTAHLLELEARLKGYQGKDYDETPLEKAEELMKIIVRQFPREAEKQLPYLEKQAALIRNQIAERDVAMAEYFESRGENLAAKIYYEKVKTKFQDTELAKTIEQRIAEVSAKPPRPEQHAQWLVDLFPNPEAEKPVIQAGNNEPMLRK
jgi:outer membrane protein assembly factor BamD (BamD/ComL family)